MDSAKFIWLALLGSSALAQNTQRLTLEQALELAEQNHPQLRAATALIEGADAGIVTARAYPNPELNIMTGGQYGRMSFNPPGPAGLLQHYSASQQLELPVVRRTRMQAARIGKESSELVLLETRRLIRGAVKQAFYEILRRRGEVELTNETLRFNEELRRRVQVQVNVGEAAQLELTRAEAEVATARTMARSAQLRYLTAISSLRSSMNAPLGTDFDPVGTLDPPALMPPLDQLLADTLGRHPAIAQADAEVRRSEARVKAEQALRLPQPSVRAEYENQPDLGFFRLGVSIPMPIWNKRQGPIGEAVAALNQAKAAADYRRLEIRGALERAYRLYEVASQQVASFEQGVLQGAEAAVAAAEAAFRFGERGIIEVLDAQRVLRSVRTDFLNAQYDRQAALIELQQLQALDIPLPGARP